MTRFFRNRPRTSNPGCASVGCCQIYLAASISGLLAVLMALAALEDWVLSRRLDPVLGTSTRNVLWAAAVINLGISAGVFGIRDRITQASLLLWLGWIQVAYRLGLTLLNASMPLVILRVLGMKVGIHARTLDFCWKLWMAYLVIGSLVVLVLAWRRRKRLATEAFFLDWRKTREKGTNLPSA